MTRFTPQKVTSFTESRLIKTYKGVLGQLFGEQDRARMLVMLAPHRRVECAYEIHVPPHVAGDADRGTEAADFAPVVEKSEHHRHAGPGHRRDSDRAEDQGEDRGGVARRRPP